MVNWKVRFSSIIKMSLQIFEALLMVILFRRFEFKLKQLEKIRQKKLVKILKAQKEYEELQKKYDSVLDSYHDLKNWGIK